MRTFKYPKFSRDQDDRCKLNDEQIREIKTRRNNGESYGEIAKDFNITLQAVFYWCLSDEEKIKRSRQREQMRKETGYYENREIDKLYPKKYRKKKKLLQGEELEDYEIKSKLRYIENNPEKVLKQRKQQDKKYYQEHKEERRKYNKQYQLAHLAQFRFYNKKCREKRIEKLKSPTIE